MNMSAHEGIKTLLTRSEDPFWNIYRNSLEKITLEFESLVQENSFLKRQIHYAKEVYHQMDRIIPETAPEAYLLQVLKDMYEELKEIELTKKEEKCPNTQLK